MQIWQSNNLHILEKSKRYHKNIRASVKSDHSIPNAGLWASVLKTEHLIKIYIKISLDVPL